MSREIKFRGKKILDDKAWVYGYYVVDAEGISYISCPNDDVWMVDPRTVGQFTGLKDSKGVEIYEGDILYKEYYFNVLVEYEDGCMFIRDTDKVRYTNKIFNVPIPYFITKEWEVIGNIHERSET